MDLLQRPRGQRFLHLQRLKVSILVYDMGAVVGAAAVTLRRLAQDEGAVKWVSSEEARRERLAEEERMRKEKEARC